MCSCCQPQWLVFFCFFFFFFLFLLFFFLPIVCFLIALNHIVMYIHTPALLVTEHIVKQLNPISGSLQSTSVQLFNSWSSNLLANQSQSMGTWRFVSTVVSLRYRSSTKLMSLALSCLSTCRRATHSSLLPLGRERESGLIQPNGESGYYSSTSLSQIRYERFHRYM